MTPTERSARWRSKNPGQTIRLPSETIDMLDALRKHFDRKYFKRRTKVDLVMEAVKLFHYETFKTE